VSSRGALVAATSRRDVDAAIRSGAVIRLRRGRYGLPGPARWTASAERVGGVCSHLTAALLWEWPVAWQPERPVVTVPRWRRLTPERRAGIDVRWANLEPDEVYRDTVTDPVRTALDCAATLPFAEALAVLDSALRSGMVSRSELLGAASSAAVRHRSRLQRRISAADARAANPFESAIRAIALEVPGLEVTPQLLVPGIGYPDLIDEELGIVIECDSFGFHAERGDLLRDCERYNAFALRGLVVIRFSWEHAMFHPEYVREVLAGVVARRRAALLAGAGFVAGRSA
jgi:hypothetical protein